MDINECKEKTNGGCHEYRSCTNTPGSFICGLCKSGYIEDGDAGCKLSDPCAAGVHNCQEDRFCHNPIPGEFYCQCPPVGYIGNGLECSPDPDLDGIGTVAMTIGCDNPKGCPAVSTPMSTLVWSQLFSCRSMLFDKFFMLCQAVYTCIVTYSQYGIQLLRPASSQIFLFIVANISCVCTSNGPKPWH